jgi:hypothetical protein
MSTDLGAVRERARAHQRELAARATFLTVQDLAARWGCADSTVRAVPFARLPYAVIGRGGRREHRRYDPALVEAYERDPRRGAA